MGLCGPIYTVKTSLTDKRRFFLTEHYTLDCTNNQNESNVAQPQHGTSRSFPRRLVQIIGGIFGLMLLCVTMMAVATPSTEAADYVSIARKAAVQAGINPDVYVRQIRQESGFNPRAYSPAGAIGIAQFMPGTAAAMHLNPRDPVASLYAGARLMAQNSRMFGGNYAKALAAYNAGPGAVQRASRIGGGRWLSYMPAETRHYVRTILG